MNKVTEESRLDERRPKDETLCADMVVAIVTNLSSFYLHFRKNSTLFLC